MADESAKAVPRKADGKWEKGAGSPNPGGRPKALKEMQALAQEHTAHAIERLRELTDSPEDAVARAACDALLDRGWGKPTQPVSGEGGGPLQVEVLKATLLDKLKKLAADAAAPPEAPAP